MDNKKSLEKYNTLYLDYATISEIESMDKNKKYTIEISDGADIMVLEALNIFLRENKLSNICFSFGGIQGYNHELHNVDCLKYLPEACRIQIFPKSKDNTINDLCIISECLIDLKEICLMGVYKKGISIEPLGKYKDTLEYIYIEQGLNKNQQAVVNLCNRLKSLRVKELDLSSLNRKSELISLHIEKDIYSINLLSGLFPNIESLMLKKCKSISDFSTIVEIESLKKLYLFFMSQIELLPSFVGIPKLETLSLILPNLINVENLFIQENLQELSVMDLKYLAPEDFYKLPQLKKLKKVYITFKDRKNTQSIMMPFIESNGWRYSM